MTPSTMATVNAKIAETVNGPTDYPADRMRVLKRLLAEVGVKAFDDGFYPVFFLAAQGGTTLPLVDAFDGRTSVNRLLTITYRVDPQTYGSETKVIISAQIS